MNLRSIVYIAWVGLLLIAPISDTLAIVLCSVSFLIAWAIGSRTLYHQHARAARGLIVSSGTVIAIFNAASLANLIYDFQVNRYVAIAIISIGCWVTFARYRILVDDLIDQHEWRPVKARKGV